MLVGGCQLLRHDPADIDGSGKAALLGRGGDGLEAYQWTGSGWTQLTGLPTLSDANGWTQLQYYQTLQYAKMAANLPGMQLVARFPDGLHVWRYVSASAGVGAGGSWVDLTPDTGGVFNGGTGWSSPQNYRTLQTAQLDQQTGVKNFVIGRAGTGLSVVQFVLASPTQGHYVVLVNGTGPFPDADGWDQPDKYLTIQPARIDATTQTWARYLPYGGYPAVDSTAFAALNTFLGIENGTIRTVFTDPANAPTASQLLTYQSDIAQTCQHLLSANPPQYQSCTPPASVSGVSPAAWTAVSNEIIAEIYGAGQVIDHFTTLGTIQTQLFLFENSAFPSIVADLKLGEETQGTVASLNYLGLYGSILELLSSLVPIPEVSTVLNITASAIGVVQAATPTLSGSQPSQFDQTYAQIQGEIATIQQQAQDALAFHQRYVLGDFGLLSTVGHLVGSQSWTLDTVGAVSASRQGFAVWVYQSFLPALWDRWAVSAMGPGEGSDCTWVPSVLCVPPGSSTDNSVSTPPDGGLGMASWQYTDNGDGTSDTSWDGLLPKQTPCYIDSSDPFSPSIECIFQSLEDHKYTDTLTYLRTPVPADCI